jgi:hypothetical protein
MTISALSHYRGGTIDEVTPVAKKLKAAYSKLGVGYRLSRFQTGPNAGDWFVVVTYARRDTPRCGRTPRHSRTSRRANSDLADILEPCTVLKYGSDGWRSAN